MEAAPVPSKRTAEPPKALLDAAERMLVSDGYARITTRSVAAEAGVNHGLVHYYFGSKERLLVEVVRRDCDIRMQLIAAAMEHASNAEEVVDGLVRSLQDLVDDDPGFIALVFEVFHVRADGDEWERVAGSEHR